MRGKDDYSGKPGFEPGLSGPEPKVLPLNYFPYNPMIPGVVCTVNIVGVCVSVCNTGLFQGNVPLQNSFNIASYCFLDRANGLTGINI
jgi:hypothetical protein